MLYFLRKRRVAQLGERRPYKAKVGGSSPPVPIFITYGNQEATRKAWGLSVYVGKAKNIRERVQQHINNASRDEKEKAIISQCDNVDWIVTRNEFEALALEIDLIQLHKPKYNVLHKHGGGYTLLLITRDEFPTVKVVRGTQHEGELFGPFFSMGKARKVKKLIHKTFRLRTCDPMPIRSGPCTDYNLGLCSGPCCGLVSKEDYSLAIESAKSLLSGDVRGILPKLYEKLELYMSEMAFEKCAYVRDQITALENLAKGQTVSKLDINSADIVYLWGRLLGVFLIRSSKLVDKQTFLLDREEDFQEFVLGFYYNNPAPPILIINGELDEESKEWLYRKGVKEIRREIKSELKSLLEENMEFLYNEEALREEFNEVLGMELPERIEGFDISHFYGDYTVGSCVVWERGFMDKKSYRRYRIKSVEGIDDYSSLEEVLTRRARRLKEGKEKMPHVWLIDGGLGQLSVALKVIERFNLPVRVFALAKKEEELIDEHGRVIRLKDYPKLYRVFAAIRNEAHRFALSYNRKLRLKEGLKDILDMVKGIGEVKKSIIYRNFPNLYEFIKADDEELRKLGIDPSIKQKVGEYLA